MAKPRSSAHAELDQLRQTVARERLRARDVDAELEAAKQRVEDISDDLTEAFAAEDQQAAQRTRKQLQAAEARAVALQNQVKGAELRAQRATRELDAFTAEHARDLLQEREPAARELAAQLTASAHGLLRLNNQFVSERGIQNQLVAATPGATPRSDGPSSRHLWEDAIRELKRAVAAHGEVQPPLPRWAAEHIQQSNSSRSVTPA